MAMAELDLEARSPFYNKTAPYILMNQETQQKRREKSIPLPGSTISA
jgi:hypothetical protein